MLVLALLLPLAQHAPAVDLSASLRRTPDRAALATVVNLGTAVSYSPAQERWIPVGRLEFGDQLDLNGDGDTMDQVLFVYDRQTGAFENLEVVVQGVPRFRGPLLPFGAYELPMQTDLNGDGDELDEIVHIYDARDGSMQSTGVAAYRSAFRGVESYMRVAGGTVFFLADEVSQGADLNGDGDALDQILRTLPLPQQRPGPGLASGLRGPALLPGLDDLVLFRFGGPLFEALRAVESTVLSFVVEALEVRDLNGDGDLADEVLHTVDGRTRSLANTGLSGDVLETFGERVVLRVYEDEVGIDLNGDGNKVDHVLLVLNVRDGSVISTRSAVRSSVSIWGFTNILGDTMLLQVDELSEFRDLNGDGDLDDQVLHIFDLVTETLVNTMLDTGGSRIGGSGSRFLFTLDESAAGDVDLNGDGDADDRVLHAITTSWSVQNLLTAALIGGGSERFVTFAVNEADQGADFNFDGDLDDFVLGIYDGELDAFRNTAISTGYRATEEVVGAKALFSVWETHEGQDLNGDGDLLDVVLHLFDADTNRVTNLGLAGSGSLGVFEQAPALATVAVEELRQGNTDLNGDGDTDDRVLHLVELP